MNLSFESKVALVTGAAGASATVAMTHIAIQEALTVRWLSGWKRSLIISTQFCHRKRERDELQA
jgi:hypothetical protein